MLAQLAARLRQRQAATAGEGDGDGDVDGDGDGDGGTIVVDDNCAVGHLNSYRPNVPVMH